MKPKNKKSFLIVLSTGHLNGSPAGLDLPNRLFHRTETGSPTGELSATSCRKFSRKFHKIIRIILWQIRVCKIQKEDYEIAC